MQSPAKTDRSKNKFQIADWCFDADLHQLQRGDEQIRLEPRVAQLLIYLVSNPGLPASREQLMEAVWPGTIVGEEALKSDSGTEKLWSTSSERSGKR